MFDSSRLFPDYFSSPPMRALFSEEATTRGWLEMESAVAQAQAELGLIPKKAGAAVARAAKNFRLDGERMERDARLVGRPIMGFVKQLREQVGGGFGDYAHWGCGTQDIMDGGMILRMRDGAALVDGELKKLDSLLAKLITRHGATKMVGRTNGQYAQEITAGIKLSAWRAALSRRRAAVQDAGGRAFFLHLDGAAGMLSAFSPRDASRLRRAVGRRLKLPVPDVHRQNMRDSVCELLSSLGLLCGTLETVGRECNLLSGDDIGEVHERAAEGGGASSMMPHKRNPRNSEFTEAVARLGRHRAAAAAELCGHRHERSGGVWIAEWLTVPEVFLLTSGALRWALLLLSSLEIDRAGMARNIEKFSGIGDSEKWTLALSKQLGRTKARQVVTAAADRARRSGKNLREEIVAAGVKL